MTMLNKNNADADKDGAADADADAQTPENGAGTTQDTQTPANGAAASTAASSGVPHPFDNPNLGTWNDGQRRQFLNADEDQRRRIIRQREEDNDAPDYSASNEYNPDVRRDRAKRRIIERVRETHGDEAADDLKDRMDKTAYPNDAIRRWTLDRAIDVIPEDYPDREERVRALRVRLHQAAISGDDYDTTWREEFKTAMPEVERDVWSHWLTTQPDPVKRALTYQMETEGIDSAMDVTDNVLAVYEERRRESLNPDGTPRGFTYEEWTNFETWLDAAPDPVQRDLRWRIRNEGLRAAMDAAPEVVATYNAQLPPEGEDAPGFTYEEWASFDAWLQDSNLAPAVRDQINAVIERDGVEAGMGAANRIYNDYYGELDRFGRAAANFQPSPPSSTGPEGDGVDDDPTAYVENAARFVPNRYAPYMQWYAVQPAPVRAELDRIRDEQGVDAAWQAAQDVADAYYARSANQTGDSFRPETSADDPYADMAELGVDTSRYGVYTPTRNLWIPGQQPTEYISPAEWDNYMAWSNQQLGIEPASYGTGTAEGDYAIWTPEQERARIEGDQRERNLSAAYGEMDAYTHGAGETTDADIEYREERAEAAERYWDSQRMSSVAQLAQQSIAFMEPGMAHHMAIPDEDAIARQTEYRREIANWIVDDMIARDAGGDGLPHPGGEALDHATRLYAGVKDIADAPIENSPDNPLGDAISIGGAIAGAPVQFTNALFGTLSHAQKRQLAEDVAAVAQERGINIKAGDVAGNSLKETLTTYWGRNR